VSQRTYGETDALEDYTRRMLPGLAELQDAVTGYRRALHDALAAPSDLPVEIEDRSAEGEDLVARLTAVDQLPAAFAFALHQLDISTFEHNGRLPGKVANDLPSLRALAYARVDHPYATDDEVRAIAPSTLTSGPGSAGSTLGATPHPGEAPIHWLSRGLNAAGETAKRLGRASPVGGAVLGGVAQHLADAEDHNLTEGQRQVRVVTTTAVDGLLGAAGAVVGGAAAFTATASPVGGAAGAVAGGDLGAAVGGRIRRSGPVSGATGSVARSIDRRNGTAHRDDYTERLTLRTPR
jgi:hypothetical protein